MKKENKLINVLQYLCLSLVFVIGLVAIIGTGGCGGGSSGGGGEAVLPRASKSKETYNFDDATLQGWTADGLWHVTDNRSSSSPNSVWYADPVSGDYNTGDI